MELTINCIVHFCSFLLSFFFFLSVHERTRSTFSRITQFALYLQERKSIPITTIVWGKTVQYV